MSKSRSLSSITVFPLHLGGSNGTRLEINAIFVPPYNAARYGITLTTSPRQANVILLFGSLTAKLAGPVYELLQSLPLETKLVLLGSEATSGAPFANAYATFGPLLDESPENSAAQGLALPPGRTIAAYVTGSPPDPQVIIEAIVAAGS